MSTALATLEFLNVESTKTGGLEMPDPPDVKQFLQQILRPPSLLFGDGFCNAPTMPTMLINSIGDLYVFGDPHPLFTRSVCL